MRSLLRLLRQTPLLLALPLPLTTLRPSLLPRLRPQPPRRRAACLQGARALSWAEGGAALAGLKRELCDCCGQWLEI